jgi:hypothetical protein
MANQLLNAERWVREEWLPFVFSWHLSVLEALTPQEYTALFIEALTGYRKPEVADAIPV